jgi:hypothetical protein
MSMKPGGSGGALTGGGGVLEGISMNPGGGGGALEGISMNPGGGGGGLIGWGGCDGDPGRRLIGMGISSVDDVDGVDEREY